jgi:signal transduction histidine kinase
VELRTESGVHLRVSDDGKPNLAGSGARTDAASRLGVAGMRERAMLLGGTLTAGPGGGGLGWLVECHLPATVMTQ